MNHDHVKEQLLLYLDNDLPEDEKRRIEAHLSTCPTCREELAYLTRIPHALKRMPQAISPGLWGAIETRILEEPQSIWTQLEWAGKRLVPLLAAAAVLMLAVLSSINGEDPNATLEDYFQAQESVILSEIELSPDTVLGLEAEASEVE